jgi:hypothetical protein
MPLGEVGLGVFEGGDLPGAQRRLQIRQGRWRP